MANIIIYDGSKKDLVYKNEFPIEKFDYNQDITGEAYSKLTVIDTEKEINKLDLFALEQNGEFFCGRIKEVSSYKNQSELHLLIGIDSYDYPVNYPASELDLNGFIFQQNQALQIKVVGDSIVAIEEERVTTANILRKLVRGGTHAFKCGFNEDETMLIVEVVNRKYEIQTYNLEREPHVANVEYTYSTEQFNAVSLRAPDSYYAIIDYYLYADGSVGKDVEQAIKPISFHFEDNSGYNSIGVAQEMLYSQKFDHEIEFNYPLTINKKLVIKDFVFSTEMLGRKMEVYIDSVDMLFETIISAVIFEEGNLKITLGFSRKRGTRQKKKEF